MTEQVNQFDLVFIVDATGSMGMFIYAAQRFMVNMLKSLSQNAHVDMQVGLVEYRDHPPQDTVVTKVHHLGSFETVQQKISGLRPQGGGDGPEAVLDGVKDACTKIKWREHARRIAVLVGDAPPHGVGGAADGFPKGCPCGDTIESVTAAAEDKNIVLYTISLNHTAHDSFRKLSQLTGGEAFESDADQGAIKSIQNIVDREFSNIPLDQQVLEAWIPESDVDSLAAKLERKPQEIADSVMRLMVRNLIRHDLVPA